MDKEKTKVIFRMFQGEVVALMPDIPVDHANLYCSSYSWDGHSAADYHGIIASSRPATPDEYADLFTSMMRIGYNVTIRKRWTRSANRQKRIIRAYLTN